jgi:hypothetical protein
MLFVCFSYSQGSTELEGTLTYRFYWHFQSACHNAILKSYDFFAKVNEREPRGEENLKNSRTKMFNSSIHKGEGSHKQVAHQ